MNITFTEYSYNFTIKDYGDRIGFSGNLSGRPLINALDRLSDFPYPNRLKEKIMILSTLAHKELFFFNLGCNGAGDIELYTGFEIDIDFEYKDFSDDIKTVVSLFEVQLRRELRSFRTILNLENVAKRIRNGTSDLSLHLLTQTGDCSPLWEVDPQNLILEDVHMNDLYTRFFTLLDASELPSVADYWTRESNFCDIKRLKKDLRGTLSSGETVMAQFYLSVWTGNNNHFDICKAAEILDGGRREIIIDWFSNPFFCS